MIGFHASHELYSPSKLIELAQLATQNGFDAVSCSDHFAPWSADGHSGYAWSWLGSAMAKIETTFGTVCAPGQRYHPAIIAQAAATLSELYPGRFWVALGTGQNLNEHITGDPWINKSQRQQRLLECVSIIRKLWDGQLVNHSGLVRVHQARLYTLPQEKPLIFGAAITDETAAWVASWADGLLTVAKPPEDLERTISAFRKAGGAGKPVCIQAAVALEKSDRIAEVSAYHNWGIAALQVDQLQDIALPEEFDHLVQQHNPSEVSDTLRISADVQRHIEWIKDDLSLGVDRVYLHYVGKSIENFIHVYSQEVLAQI